MSVEITAGFFSVVPNNDSIAHMTKMCKSHAMKKRKKPFEVALDSGVYRMSDPMWNSSKRLFTATIWKKRDTRLPSTLDDSNAVQPLPINKDQDLGEPASIAYLPSKEACLIEYNHNGPRHGVLRAFLGQMGTTAGVSIEPMIRDDALARLKKAELVRKIKFGFTPQSATADAFKDIGGPVAGAIEAMDSVNGVSVRVKITMGHSDGGLAKATTKKVLERLAKVGVGVQAVKAGVKEKDESGTVLLDLLHGRLVVDLQVAMSDRYVDSLDCRTKLADTLLRHFGL